MKNEEFATTHPTAQADSSFFILHSSLAKYLAKHGFEAFRPKAVLFDMDGVLYDSMPNHAVAWQKSMKEFGIVMSRADAYATEGQRGVDTIRQMVLAQKGHDIGEAEAQEMYNLKTKYFHEMDEPPMMPGALQLMEQIHHCGMAIGVVTGSGQRPLIARLMKDYGQYLSVGHIVTAYDVKRGKPHPDPYLEGMVRLGNLNPWNTIVVENAPLGVEAAVAARAFTICVNSGQLPTHLFEERSADLIFDSMWQLNEQWKMLGWS